MRVIVTGGAGFIGSAVVRRLVARGDHVLNIDKLTYAGDLRSVAECASRPNYRFAQADVCNREAMADAFEEFRPELVLHLAAESHVDRSIDEPGAFLSTNVMGTFALLETAAAYVRQSTERRAHFRMIAVSTDEVYGSLGDEGLFSEASPYAPNSPYSASKAAADHLARAWHATYGLSVMISNCTNNYGPFQNPEKLIPTVIRNALGGRPIPVYGTGRNVRDWIFVDDHVEGLLLLAGKGRVGENYLFGGAAEITNIELVRLICDILDTKCPRDDDRSYRDQIKFIADRPGHDHRYAADSSKVERELGWTRAHNLKSGLEHTVGWYLSNRSWLESIPDAGRLGLARPLH